MAFKSRFNELWQQGMAKFHRKESLTEGPAKKEYVRAKSQETLFEPNPLCSRQTRLQLNIVRDLCGENNQKKQAAIEKLSGNEEALLAALDVFKRTSTDLFGTGATHYIRYHPVFFLSVYGLDEIQKSIGMELAKMVDTLENPRALVAVASYSKDEIAIGIAEKRLTEKGQDSKTRCYREISFGGELDEGDYA